MVYKTGGIEREGVKWVIFFLIVGYFSFYLFETIILYNLFAFIANK